MIRKFRYDEVLHLGNDSLLFSPQIFVNEYVFICTANLSPSAEEAQVSYFLP